ncbi:MAG: NAD(P)-binding domain-containing protein, partial [Acidimicrobiia bacterium]
MSGKADIAVVGLGVMGANLALNLADNGYKVIAHNRTASVTDDFMAGEAGRFGIVPAYSIEEMVGMLERPRTVLIMVTAGGPVDQVIDSLSEHLDAGDIIVDGGNSLYTDTDRRQRLVESRGHLYLGIGVSGGEEGARHGPSIMPGGSPE